MAVIQDKAFWQMQMDLIVKKMIEESGGEPETPVAPQPSPTKACRYGSACNRPNCRFRHPGQNQGDIVVLIPLCVNV